MSRKYLEDLGMKIPKGTIPGMDNVSLKTDKRRKVFKKQIKKYGFDARDTWNLHFTTACWLYEHLMMFKEKAGKVINLKYHKFDVVTLDEEGVDLNSIEEYENYYKKVRENPDDGVMLYKEKKQCLNQKQCINLMIDYLATYIKRENGIDTKRYDTDYRINSLKDIAAEEKAEYAIKIYAEVFPCMWW